MIKSVVVGDYLVKIENSFLFGAISVTYCHVIDVQSAKFSEFCGYNPFTFKSLLIKMFLNTGGLDKVSSCDVFISEWINKWRYSRAYVASSDKTKHL